MELSSFGIARHPVSNAEYLALREQDSYQEASVWSDRGWSWRVEHSTTHPDHWRRNERGEWFDVGVNGPGDLSPNAPVMGISLHEALAFADWATSLGGELVGAVLLRKYQWEVAARAGVIESIGRCWEWCTNAFHPCAEFRAYPDEDVSARFFDQRHFSLRGGCLHTQPSLRRSSFRNFALLDTRTHFAGTRLVFPPLDPIQ